MEKVPTYLPRCWGLLAGCVVHVMRILCGLRGNIYIERYRHDTLHSLID